MDKTYTLEEVDSDLNAIYMQHLMENVVPSYIEDLAEPEDVLEVVIKPLFRELDDKLAEECVKNLYQLSLPKIRKILFKKQTAEQSAKMIRDYMEGASKEEFENKVLAKHIIDMFRALSYVIDFEEGGLR